MKFRTRQRITQLLNKRLMSLLSIASIVVFTSCIQSGDPGAKSKTSQDGDTAKKQTTSSTNKKMNFYNIRKDYNGRGVIALTNSSIDLDFSNIKGSIESSSVTNFRLVRSDGSSEFEIDGGLPIVDSYGVSISGSPYSAVVLLTSGETKTFTF